MIKYFKRINKRRREKKNHVAGDGCLAQASLPPIHQPLPGCLGAWGRQQGSWGSLPSAPSWLGQHHPANLLRRASELGRRYLQGLPVVA